MKNDFIITKIDSVLLFRKQKNAESYASTLQANELVFDFSGECIDVFSSSDKPISK